MSSVPAQPSRKPRNPKIYKKAEAIKSDLDRFISKIQKASSYQPERADVAKYAIEINDLIMNNREQVRSFESYLKAAIIDLTEIPEMHPQMQRISFLAALKDASYKIQLFLDCC